MDVATPLTKWTRLAEKIGRNEICLPAAAGELELPNSARNTKNIFTLKMATVEYSVSVEERSRRNTK